MFLQNLLTGALFSIDFSQNLFEFDDTIQSTLDLPTIIYEHQNF